MAGSSVQIFLITRTGCGGCAQFLAGPWKTLKDQLSYGIGGGPVEQIDVVRDGIDKVPLEIRKLLQFVPWIYALYSDGKVEALKNSPGSAKGLEELKQWASQGPPRYASTSTSIEADSDTDSLVNPRYEVVVLTQEGCGHCAAWEASGDLQKFLDSLPSNVDKIHYDVKTGPPTDPDDARRRLAVTGINVPTVFVVAKDKWTNPTSKQLQASDILLSPVENRFPTSLPIFKRWLSLLTDQKTPFLGYLVLSTSASCGHCRQWKSSGGMDQFVKANMEIPGVLLIHNGKISQAIKRQINGVPSAVFVPANQWNSENPEVIQAPDVRSGPEFAAWVSKLKDGVWSNDEQFLPQDYQQAAVALEPRRAAPSLAARRPLRRQAFH